MADRHRYGEAEGRRPDSAELREARKQGFATGMFYGVLIGAILLPGACSMLPDSLRENLRSAASTNGEPPW